LYVFIYYKICFFINLNSLLLIICLFIYEMIIIFEFYHS
jgi:hypothetical protein